MVMFEMIDTFKRLDTIAPPDQPLVGGKAFNCARLKQAGIPVPDGVVVPCDATDEQVQLLASEPWLDTVPAGTLFAVRSSGIGEDSAGHSFAGIHETQLDVARDQLVEAVLVCRRSAASEQAVAYRRARNLGDESARIAVLVQRMVPAVTSGVAFTVNPITGADELVVNAAWGLGEALVSGRVDPDEFRISKRDASVLSARRGTGNQQAAGEATLSASQLTELAGLLGRIEAHYGAPQDVEWCHDGEQFWIVQSRPVTTAAGDPDSTVPDLQSAIGEQSGVRDSASDIEWTRANLAEVFPDQLSPQVLAAYEEMLNRAERQFMGRILAPEAELGPMFKSFRGRMYMNLSQMRRVAWLIGAPFADMLRSLGHPEQIHPDDELPTRAPFRAIRPAIRDFLRVAFYDATAARVFRQHEARIAGLIARLTRVDPRTLDDRAVWDTIQWWLEAAPDSVQIVFVMSGVLTRETALRKACAEVGFPYEKLVYSQLAAGARSVSTRQPSLRTGLKPSTGLTK